MNKMIAGNALVTHISAALNPLVVHQYKSLLNSGNDGGTLGTTAGSDCYCYWHDILAQKHQK